MKPQTFFHIPEPCHEDWNNMTPEGRGRFCASCNKQVVDFSLMSDQQVLNYFKNATGNACGRFANDQLDRPMHETIQPKKKVWWVAAVMPLLLLINKANGQTKGKVLIKKPYIVSTKIEPLTGLVVSSAEPTQGGKIIKGSVQNENGIPVPFATVSLKNSIANAITDSLGNFELHTRSLADTVCITVSSLGYKSREYNFPKQEAANVIITLQEKNYALPTVCVTAPVCIKTSVCITSLAGRMGGVMVVRSITIRQKIDTAIRKVFKNTAFNIYPNPVKSNATFKLAIKNTGEYVVQMLDNNGKPIITKDIITADKNTMTEIQTPDVAAGMYYIRLIDKNKKKQYTDKIMVQ